MVRIVCSILIVLVTMGATIALTRRAEEPDIDACRAAEDRLAEAYIHMRTICNGHRDLDTEFK